MGINKDQAWKEYQKADYNRWKDPVRNLGMGFRPAQKPPSYMEHVWLLPDLFLVGEVGGYGRGWVELMGYFVVPRTPKSEAQANKPFGFYSHGPVLTGQHYYFVGSTVHLHGPRGNWTSFQPDADFWATAPAMKYGTKAKATKAAIRPVLEAYRKYLLSPGNTLRQERLKALKPNSPSVMKLYNLGVEKGKTKGKKERGTSVDYALWCILTGDEEDTRLSEEPSDWLRDWKADGVPTAVLGKLDRLFIRGYNGGWDGFDYDSFKPLLWPYRSHKNLTKDAWYDWADEVEF